MSLLLRRLPLNRTVLAAALAVVVCAAPLRAADEPDSTDQLLSQIPMGNGVRLGVEIFKMLSEDDPPSETEAQHQARLAGEAKEQEKAEADAAEAAKATQEQNAAWNTLIDQCLTKVADKPEEVKADEVATALVVYHLLNKRQARVLGDGKKAEEEAGVLIDKGVALDDHRFHLMTYILSEAGDRPDRREALDKVLPARGAGRDVVRLMDLCGGFDASLPKAWNGGDSVFVAFMPEMVQPTAALGEALLTRRRDSNDSIHLAPGETRTAARALAWNTATQALDPVAIAVGADLLRDLVIDEPADAGNEQLAVDPGEDTGRSGDATIELARDALTKDSRDVGWLFTKAAVEDETDGHLTRWGEWAAVEAVLAALCAPDREERVPKTLRAFAAIADTPGTDSRPWRASTFLTCLGMLQAPVGGANRIPLAAIDPEMVAKALVAHLAESEPQPAAYDAATDLALSRLALSGLAVARRSSQPPLVRAVGAAVAIHAWSRLTVGFTGDPAARFSDAQTARQVGGAFLHLSTAVERGWLAALPPALYWSQDQVPHLLVLSSLALARTAQPPFGTEDEIGIYADLARRLGAGGIDTTPIDEWISANTQQGDDLTFPPAAKWFPYMLARKAIEAEFSDPDGTLHQLANQTAK